MLIKVTEQHVLKGRQWAAEFCPIAIALTEALSLSVSVYRNITCGLFDCPTPPEVFQKIRHYDLTKTMQPFDFEIPFHVIGGYAVQYLKDGNQWCATLDDFADPQESLAGFGNTEEEAFIALKEEYDNQSNTETH